MLHELATMDLIERMPADLATSERLWGDTNGLRRIAAYRERASVANKPRYLHALAEAMRFADYCYNTRGGGQLLMRATQGAFPRVAHREIREAMTISDFPLLFGDTLDRQLLGGYAEGPYTWANYCRRSTVPDFRIGKRFTIDGAEGVLTKVPEKTPYPTALLTEGKYELFVEKYGRTLDFSWEAMIDDDLGAFRDQPQRLGKATRRSEEKFATQLHVDASGPHASLYTAGNKNIINTTNGASANNPVLGIPGLQDALIVLSNLRDADGEPIVVQTVELVVPPALAITAQNILNATELRLNAAGGSTTQQLITRNWMTGMVRLSVNYYIPIVASTANGGTSWFLFASTGAGRPALEMGFLRGYEEPQLFVKAPDQQRIGGGSDAMDGDFATDNILWKVRHCFGGSRIDPKATVASNGSGV